MSEVNDHALSDDPAEEEAVAFDAYWKPTPEASPDEAFDEWLRSMEQWPHNERIAFTAAWTARREAVEEAEEYAAEGWAWLHELLRLGGWTDVFEAQDALRRRRENALAATNERDEAVTALRMMYNAFFGREYTVARKRACDVARRVLR